MKKGDVPGVNRTSFFDAEAARWNERYMGDARFARRFEKISTLFDRVLPNIPGCALDAGCGSGMFSRELARRGWQVTAIDASPEMIAAARTSSPPSIEYSVQSLESLPSSLTAENSFELILSVSTLEYLEDDEAVLANFSRMLKPEGILIISVPNRKGLLRVMEGAIFGARTATRGRIFSKRGDYLLYQKRQYAPMELNLILRRLGLRKVMGVFMGTGITLPKPLLPFFERRWWAAMYCAAYRKSATNGERSDRA